MILTKQLDEETQLLLPYSAGEIFVERSALFRYSINSGELFASPWSPLINQLSGPIKSPPSLDIEYLFLCFGSKKPDPTFVDVSMYGLETDYDIFSRIFDVYQEETGWFTLRKISSMKMVKVRLAWTIQVSVLVLTHVYNSSQDPMLKTLRSRLCHSENPI